MLLIQMCVRYLSNSETLKYMSKLKGSLKLLNMYFWFISVFFQFSREISSGGYSFLKKINNCLYLPKYVYSSGECR